MYLGLVRFALPLIFAGQLLTIALGLWLVSAAESGYSYGSAWIVSALVLWVVASALGGRGGKLEETTRKLAERLSLEGDTQTPELRARLRDPVSFVLNFGSGLAVFAVLALMIWKPGS
jgi:uncharacterized membrane protein